LPHTVVLKSQNCCAPFRQMPVLSQVCPAGQVFPAPHAPVPQTPASSGCSEQAV